MSNDMTWRQMIAVGVRRVILARGELDKLEGPGYGREEGRVTPRGESKGGSDRRENDESGTTAS